MKKKYQIFISSTFNDLQEERTAIMRTVVKLGHFPAGMEFFGAVNDKSINEIKRVIDESDYYVLITKGRYGTVSPNHRVSYTEFEYKYALASKKPIIAFIHENYRTLPLDTVDTEENRLRLDTFIKKVKDGKGYALWRNTDDLVGKISAEIPNAIERYPTSGWLSLNSLDTSVDNLGVINIFGAADKFYKYLDKILENARVVRIIHFSNHTQKEIYSETFKKFLFSHGTLRRIICRTSSQEVQNWIETDLREFSGHKYVVNYINKAVINLRLMAIMIIDDQEVLLGTGRTSPQQYQSVSIKNREIAGYFGGYFEYLLGKSKEIELINEKVDWNSLNE